MDPMERLEHPREKSKHISSSATHYAYSLRKMSDGHVEYFNEDSDSSSMEIMSDWDWSKLLDMIADGRVVPVIGPELLSLPDQPEGVGRLYDVWGRKLAEIIGVDIPESVSETPLLYQVANRAKTSKKVKTRGDLEFYVSKVIGDPTYPIPDPLRKLAQINDFKLYISTTIDHLMFKALSEYGVDQSEISFKMGGDSMHHDLPDSYYTSPTRLVFNVFGSSCPDPQAFAATEDGLIEFSWALINDTYAPKKLFEFIQKKRLIFLGCNFPDWLDRFFIHSLTRQQGLQVEMEFVSQTCPLGLAEFLERRGVSIWHQYTPMAFVCELHRRWQDRHEQEGLGNGGLEGSFNSDSSIDIPLKPMKKGAVFLSYAREDQNVAYRIRNQLDAARIDAWIDERSLEPGADFEKVIRENISNASFFLAVISHSLDISNSDRPGRFVFKEWKWAEDAALERIDTFLVPVAVDNTKEDAPFLGGHFREKNWVRLSDGKLPEKVIEFLKDGIKRYRRPNSTGQ